MWVKALHDEDPFACVAVFLSQLHNLQTLRLDWSVVRISGFPGLMFYYALSSAPNGMPSAFGSLTVVDYGSNVPTVLENNDEAYPSAWMRCNEYQFTAWFYLPSLRSLAIWLPTRQDVLVPELDTSLGQLHTLAIARSMIGEEQASRLLSAATAVQKLHLDLFYKWGGRFVLENRPGILQVVKVVSSTVTGLSIGLEYYPWCHVEDKVENLILPFCDILSNFSNLKSAEIPALLLCWNRWPTDSVDVTTALPSTLQNLCLRMDCEEGRSAKAYEQMIITFVTDNVRRLRSHSLHLNRICLRIFWP